MKRLNLANITSPWDALRTMNDNIDELAVKAGLTFDVTYLVQVMDIYGSILEDAVITINGTVGKTAKVAEGAEVTIEVSCEGYLSQSMTIPAAEIDDIIPITLLAGTDPEEEEPAPEPGA